jgi:hypothetical protein
MLQNATLIKKETFGELNFEFYLKENTLEMKWVGESTLLTPQIQLNTYFDELVPQIKTYERLKIDFSGLIFMNAATIKPILYLLKKLDEIKMPTSLFYDYNE